MKTGLVLEGGGIRGIFSAGVIDVLMEEGITFDGGIGVSAGAAFGSNYKSGQNRRAIRYNLRFAKDPRYSSIRSLIATGNLFNAQFCYHDIPEKLDPFDWETFRKNPMEFYLVCTDAETGEPVYHLCDCEKEDQWELLEWFRASGSMPLVSRVVEIGGKKLLDGGVTDSIPLKFMEDQGYERNVVILTRPADYIKKPNTMMPVIRRAMNNYPAMVDAMEYRHVMYNAEIAYIRKREAEHYAFVIRPARDLDVGRVEHDRMKIRAAYKEGRRMARRLLPDIRRFLAGARAETDLGTIKPSMIEEEPVKVSKVVKASMVEDPALNMETKYGVPEDTSESGTCSKTRCREEEKNPAQTAQTTMFRDPPAEKKRVQEVRSVLVGEPDDEPVVFERPFPGDRTPDLPSTAGEETAVVNRSAANRPRKKRQKKAWKPGQMTSLKQQAGLEE